MVRKTIIFGNGLGMALDPTAFQLTIALKDIWDNPFTDFTEENKALIRQCLPSDAGIPTSETDLDKLHLAVTGCETLRGLFNGSPGNGWLSKRGEDFPKEVRVYLFMVAKFFHSVDKKLPEPFIESLSEFIRKTNSHVATLNYDRLLYEPFVEKGLCKGYDDCLVDGMWSTGFKLENLERNSGKTFGYYMHLHGSPLFVDRNGVTTKLGMRDRPSSGDEIGKHLVLTHVKHKPAVIASSHVLQAYWEYFNRAMIESQEIVVFGYSGQDAHLNRAVASVAPSRSVRVIEWIGAGQESVRRVFWQKSLGASSNLKYEPQERMLDFTGWE